MLQNKTITLDELLELGFDVGLSKYPIFDESYRPILNNRIIEFYRFRQIGFENPKMFQNRMELRMDMIMSNKYNRLYEIKQTDFNPLYNVEMHETYTHTIDNENTNSNTSNSSLDNAVNYNSNTTNKNTDSSSENQKNSSVGWTSQYPTEEMIEDNLNNHVFADQGQHSSNAIDTTNTNTSSSEMTQDDVTKNTTTSSNKSDGTSKNTTTETYKKDTIGSSAGLPFSVALKQFKDFYDSYELDMQVIDELKDLFYNLW